MEVIRLSGYVSDEKIAIAEKYLAPVAKDMAGLKDAYTLAIPLCAIATLIAIACLVFDHRILNQSKPADTEASDAKADNTFVGATAEKKVEAHDHA